MKKKTILLLYDESNFDYLYHGGEFRLKFSHDVNLSQLGQAALDNCYTAHFTTISRFGQRKIWDFKKIYPIVEINGETEPLDQYDIIASCGAEMLLLKEKYPRSKIVAFFAAVHFIESPGLHDQTWLYKISLALRLHVDAVVTQNSRMAEIIDIFAKITSSVSLNERILVCPVGLWELPRKVSESEKEDEKKKFSLSESILFGNAGGIWRWTDYLTFLKSFIEYQRSKKTNQRLIITGITQENNLDHAEHTKQIRQILSNNSDMVEESLGGVKPIIYIKDWAMGGKILKEILPMLDIGLNLNTDTLEGWQSYRVRVLDYLSNNIPILNTSTDLLYQTNPGAGFIPAKIGSIDSYKQIFESIAEGKIEIKKLRKGQESLINSLFYKDRFAQLIEKLEKMPVRTVKDPKDLPNCIYDHAKSYARWELRKRLVEESVDIMAHSIAGNYKL